jgi:hypothetical protein
MVQNLTAKQWWELHETVFIKDKLIDDFDCQKKFAVNCLTETQKIRTLTSL